MKEFLNKKVKIKRVNKQGDILYYTAKVLAVTDNHITIKDREGLTIGFKIYEIEDIKEVAE